MEKFSLIDKIEEQENIQVELAKWEPGVKLSIEVSKIVGEIKDEGQRDVALRLSEKFLHGLKSLKNKDDGKKYLSEIIEEENIEFKTNNLIISPVGSGKSYLIRNLIEEGDNVLLLVSTSSLKMKLAPESDELKKKISNNMYSTKNKKVYGDKSYKILVMTYAEFGENIKYSLSFQEQFDKIFCDEIHSLPLYQSYNDSSSLLLAIHYLFSKNESQKKFYFTATTEQLDILKNKSKDLFKHISYFDYLSHPDIKRYMPLSSYKIDGIEQVRPHLKARKESFEYFGYKMFAFCKTIEGQKRLKKICEEEGFSAQAYWSVNNEENQMSDEQIKEMEQMILDGKLPDKYDVVIINSALQEGWDLKDERVKLAIINTTNETEYVQSLGRIRNNLDILIYKSKENEIACNYINFPSKYIGKPLDSKLKNSLCQSFNLKNENGRLLKWASIEKLLENQGFTIVSKQMTLEGKRKRVSIVYAK